MHVVELEYSIEQAVRDAVQRHFPLDWKEDPITHDLLIRLRDVLRQVTIHDLRTPLLLECEIYKLHGRREATYGDIGLLVRYTLPAGGSVEGAGFLEAKVRGRDTTKFPQVRHEQVARLLARSPQTRLLLYDYNAVSVLSPADVDRTWDLFPHHYRYAPSRASVSHAPVLPLQLAATINQYDDTLYRFAHAFSFQLVWRYLQLHDLDFSDAAVQAVKGFPGELGSPNHVLIIRGAPVGQELPEEFVPNTNLYTRLE
jgi:hypothetical protein